VTTRLVGAIPAMTRGRPAGVDDNTTSPLTVGAPYPRIVIPSMHVNAL
jgi:hypothetical protein